MRNFQAVEWIGYLKMEGLPVGPFLILAIVSYAGCVVAKFAISLRVKVLEKELSQERTSSKSARKIRNEAIEESKLLNRDLGRLQSKQTSLEQGLHRLAMMLTELEQSETTLQEQA
jgi:hypothetical protein